MIKTVLYPFGKTSIPILNHASFLEKDMIIQHIVSPNGWGYANDCFKMENDRIINVETEFEKALDDSDAVWIVDSEEELEFEKYILPQIQKAIKSEKKVIFSRKINQIEETLVYSKFGNTATKILNKDELPLTLNQKLFNINTPVIAFCNYLDGLSSLDLQLSLWKLLNDMGHKTLLISDQKMGAKMGAKIIPDYIMYEGLDVRSRVFHLNDFIKRKEEESKPDIILLSIHGGTNNLSRYCLGQCGFLHFMIPHAVNIDIGILTVPFSDYSEGELLDMADSIFSRFGIKIDFFHVEKKLLIVADSDIYGYPRYLQLDTDFVEKGLNSLNNSCIGSYSDKYVSNLAHQIVDELTSFGEVIQV